MTRILAGALLAIGLSVAALAQPPAAVPDGEWKRWLDQVRPLMLESDVKAARITAPSARSTFREDFWRARNPDPANPDNPARTEFERRVQAADARFRINGKSAWNDCGRVYIVLGKPDWMRNNQVAQHFSSSDPFAAFSEQDQVATEMWVYRNNPRLPSSPNGFVFRFNPSCEAVGAPSADRLLQQAAATYVSRAR
jgi:GWxTD domain-containing protein